MDIERQRAMNRAKSARWRAAHLDDIRARARPRAMAYYYSNRAILNSKKKEKYANKPEETRFRARVRYAAKREEIKAKNAAYARANRRMDRAWKSAWKKKNPEFVAADAAQRRAIRRHALPPWADRKAIRAIYAEAAARTRATGIVHHVDHIYPLRGQGFVGMHVPWNLAVLTGTENIAKSNRVAPAMLSRRFT